MLSDVLQFAKAHGGGDLPGAGILLTVLAFNLMVTVCVTRSSQTEAVRGFEWRY